MKKVLAFVLVLAMVLGSVSMAFAKTDYKDEAAITNKEAVQVLSMLKVLEGDANGFRPTDTLTRAEAAAIIARLALGREDADKLAATGNLFSDVPATHWAAGYIAYCVSQGIIAGNGDGTFDPEGVLTVSAFTKMALCALGYEAAREGLTGSNWEANTATLAVKAGISVSATGACTRETAAQIGLNTLKADTVEYAQAAVTVNTGGAQVVVGGSNATVVEDKNLYDYDGSEALLVTQKLQLVEKVYGAKVTLNKNGVDDFGNPANVWSYKTEEVTAAKTPIATFTKKYSATTAADKKAVLATVKNYVFAGTKIANETTSSTGALGVTGLGPIAPGTPIVEAICGATENGRLVEIFADSNKNITDVVTTTYEWSKIASVTTNSKGDVTYTGSNGLTGKDFADETDDTIKLYGEVAKNDYVTFVKKGTVTYVYPATKVVGTQTAKSNTSITVDGTTYKLASGLQTPPNIANFDNSKKAANYYLDQYGFVFACSDVDADLVFAVVDRIALKTGTGVSSAKTIEAVLIFTDGTKQTVNVAKYDGKKPSEVPAASMGATYTDATNQAISGHFFSYEVNSDGSYELKPAANGADFTAAVSGAALINKGVAKVATTAISGNADTIYIIKSYKSGTTDEVINVYTGYANVPTVKASANGSVGGSYVVDANNNQKVLTAYINATDSTLGDSTTKNIFYATANYDANAVTGTGSDAYLTIKGYLNGEATTLQFKAGASGAALVVKGGFYKLVMGDDGFTTEFNAPGFTLTGTAVQADVDSVALGTLNGYTINDDTVTYVIDADHVMSESAASVITSGSAFYFNVVKSDGTTVEKNTIKTLYIKQND